VTWGKDLERALARVDAIPSDRIGLVRTGGVDVRVRGGAGDAVDVQAQRGEWTVKCWSEAPAKCRSRLLKR
jgi:hypothetical protein